MFLEYDISMQKRMQIPNHFLPAVGCHQFFQKDPIKLHYHLQFIREFGSNGDLASPETWDGLKYGQ